MTGILWNIMFTNTDYKDYKQKLKLLIYQNKLKYTHL